MNYYRKHLKINSSPVKETEKKDDNILSNDNDDLNSNEEESHNYQRRLNTDINDDNIIQNNPNPIYLRKKDSYKFFRINKPKKEKEKNIIENEVENNRMKKCEKKIINKPSFLELNNDIFSNSDQNGVLYFNSTKNGDHKKFEYPENINKIKITNQLYKKKRDINFNKYINNNIDNCNDNDNDNDNFNVFGGNDNFEENLNINEIENNKLPINNRNEIKKNLNIDENIMNRKKYTNNKKFVSLRNNIDENIQNGLVHFSSNKNVYLKDNSENNNNKKVKEDDTKNNKSPVRQNKIVDSEVLKTVDNRENRQKKFMQKYQLNSNLKNKYIRHQNYNSIFPKRNINNKLINVNNNQRTDNNNKIDEEKKSYKNYRIDNQNKDNKIENNEKEKNNKELLIENKDNKIEKNDIKFKKNDNKIENIDNNIDYCDFKIKNNDYKIENREKKNKKIKIENRDNNINKNDIKIENNDIKIEKKDNKLENKNNKIENKDKNADNNDIKIENNNYKIGNFISDRINYIFRSIFDFNYNNIKADDTNQKINNSKDNKIKLDNENNNNNLINNNHDNNNRIKINNKISDDPDKIAISKLKNDNNNLSKNEINKNTIDNNNKKEININNNNKIVDEHHKIDINKIKDDNKRIKDKLINDNKKVCEYQSINKNINKNENNDNNNDNINNNKRKITNENNNNDGNDDDIDANLNVNEILKNKNEENSQKEEQNPKKNLQDNTIKKESERKNRRMRYQKSYSSANFFEDPCNNRLFKTINIFNSFLIMLNNISNINDYLSDNKIVEEIKNINKNDRFNLITIFFNLNKLFWHSPNEMNITEVDLLKKYENFIDLFLKSYCKRAISTQFYIDINNMENIIFNIFNHLNGEITQINNKNISNYCYNNNNNNNYNSNNLSIYINNFFRDNNSVISHDFTGFYEKSIYCENCQLKYARLRMNYNKYIYYEHFFYINFDMNEINNFVKNNNQKIKLDFCFNYILQKNKFNYKLCNQCFVNGKKEITSIYSAPNILTIILSKNENTNFVLQEELDLKKYSYYSPGDGVYLLMSVLCRINYNGKFISYCLNPKNGSWYSYTDGKIKRVRSMDINAIPLVLIYQIRGTIKFIYEGLNWNEDKIKITVKFQMPGLQPKDLFFSKKALVKDVIDDVISIFNLYEYKEENEIKLLVNGGKADNDELLINALGGNNNVLIIFRKK